MRIRNPGAEGAGGRHPRRPPRPHQGGDGPHPPGHRLLRHERIWPCQRYHSNSINLTIVADPDPDPDVLGQMYESGSVSFYHKAKIVKKTLIPTVLWLLFDLLSLNNDVNAPSKSNKQKKFFFKLVFCWPLEDLWRKSQDPNPLVRGVDPRIQIRFHTKMSWIRNTEFNSESISEIICPSFGRTPPLSLSNSYQLGTGNDILMDFPLLLHHCMPINQCVDTFLKKSQHFNDFCTAWKKFCYLPHLIYC